MCWSFVIKPGCTANESWLWWEDAFLSRKEGHTHLELKAWNSVTKHQMSRIEGWKGFTTVFRTRWSRCPLLATAWTPDLQDLGPGCVYEDVTGTLELDMFTLETIDLAFRRETTTNQAMPLALLLGIWRPEFLPDLSANSDDTASQVNYDSKPLGKKGSSNLCPHILPHVMKLLIEKRNLESRLSQNEHSPTDLVPGFLSVVISVTLLLKKIPFQWTTVTQGTFSHRDVVFTSIPVLLYPDWAPFFMWSQTPQAK